MDVNLSVMRIPLNDLSRSAALNDGQVSEALERVRRSGNFILGPETRAFEEEFASFLGNIACAGVSSGTAALELALLGIGCGFGSGIVVAPNAGSYSSIAAQNIGARVVYADIDPDSHILTPATVKAVLDNDIQAVVVTHLYGNVVDVQGIREVCGPGVRVIEDCAQAAGASYLGGGRVGSLGDASAFSFYPTKNLGALGDAGAVVSSSPTVIERVKQLRQYGWENRYHIVASPGMNSRIDELQAAVLRARLPILDVHNDRRRSIVRRMKAALRGSTFKMVTASNSGSVAHLAVIQAPTPDIRNRVRAHLETLGVMTDVHYPLLDTQQRGLAKPLRESSLEVASEVPKQVFTIPCFPEMTDAEIAHVESSLTRIVREVS